VRTSARERIVCAEQESVKRPTVHAHIVAVGTGTDPNHATTRWTLSEVIQAILHEGDNFYTQGISSGRVASVRVANCIHCGRQIIESSADAVEDNNLDYLRPCSNFTKARRTFHRGLRSSNQGRSDA
jgi:hypothetical protein